MADYTNIKDILKQFELQVVQGKHYKKSETMTSAQITTAISNAIAGVDQMHIVIASDAGTTPAGINWTKKTGGSTITGTLSAFDADKHTIYYVKSNNGTDDAYDEYMALTTDTNTYAWEKIGNTDVNLSNYVQKTRKVNGHALSSDVTVTKSDVGLGDVTNVATESTITSGSSNNITSGAVYTALNKAVSSTSNGITLGGKVGAPTITCTSGSVTQGGGSFVNGGTVYDYVTGYAQPIDADLTAIAALTGTSGLLKKTAENTWALDTNTYLTTSSASSAYAGKTEAVGFIGFDSTNGFRSQKVSKAGSTTASDFETIVTIANLKSGLGINNVTNVATESTITQNSTKNITSGAVYTALNKALNSSSSGIALGGTVKAPTITVTGGSINQGGDFVVKGGTVYDCLFGTSGVLKISDTDFETMLSEV